MLKQKFKGMINPSTIWYVCPEKWKREGLASSGRRGGLSTQQGLNSSPDEEPLTEYEKQYVKVHEDKTKHNEHVVALIDYYLGFTEPEKTVIFGKAKRKGSIS